MGTMITSLSARVVTRLPRKETVRLRNQIKCRGDTLVGLESKAGRSQRWCGTYKTRTEPLSPLLPPCFSRKLKAENGKEGALRWRRNFGRKKTCLITPNSVWAPLNSSPVIMERGMPLLWTAEESVSSLLYCLPDFRPKGRNHLDIVMQGSDNLGKSRFVPGLSELTSQVFTWFSKCSFKFWVSLPLSLCSLPLVFSPTHTSPLFSS